MAAAIAETLVLEETKIVGGMFYHDPATGEELAPCDIVRVLAAARAFAALIRSTGEV